MKLPKFARHAPRGLTLLLGLALCAFSGCGGGGGSSSSAPSSAHVAFPLVASANKRYLQDQNGTPFPILGRTAWFITSLSVAEYKTFIDDTVAKGYNAIEFHVINHDPDGNNAPVGGNGSVPFTTRLSDGMPWTGIGSGDPDFTQRNETYWLFVDALLDYAESKGLLCFLFPAYVGASGGSDGWMAEMTANGPSNMANYGAFIANRYKARGNIVWMLGGDYGTFANSFLPLQLVAEQGLLAGMKSVPGQQSTNFSAEWWGDSIYTDQTDTTLQSAGTLQGGYSFLGNVSTVVGRGYAHTPVMPTFLLEEPYDEEGADGTGVNLAATQPVRRFQWWGWLSSIGGYISGNGFIWTFQPGWPSHLNTQGAQDMARLNGFIKSIPWQDLVPDGLGGIGTLVTSGKGTIDDTNYWTAAANPAKTLLVAYGGPSAGNPTIDMTKVNGRSQVLCRWFDPTNGSYSVIGTFPNTGTHTFTLPGSNFAGDGDWVLRLDAI